MDASGPYLGVMLIVAAAALIGGALATFSWLFGPKKVTPYKNSPYECGVQPSGDARERFPIKFYLVAIVFILFDIEIIFLWPWISMFKGSDTAFMVFSFVEFLIYMGTWLLAYLYIVRVRAIDWDESTTLHPAKLGDVAAADEARETDAA